MKTMLKIALIVLMAGILSCINNDDTEKDSSNLSTDISQGNSSEIPGETTPDTSEPDGNQVGGRYPIPSDWDLTSEPFDPVIHAEQKAAWEALHISSYRFLLRSYHAWEPITLNPSPITVYPNGKVDGPIWRADGERRWNLTVDEMFENIGNFTADYAQYGDCSIRYNPTFHYPELFYEDDEEEPGSILYVQYFEVLE